MISVHLNKGNLKVADFIEFERKIFPLVMVTYSSVFAVISSLSEVCEHM